MYICIYIYITLQIWSIVNFKLERENFLSRACGVFSNIFWITDEVDNFALSEFRRETRSEKELEREAQCTPRDAETRFFLCAQNALRFRGESLRENCETNGWCCVLLSFSRSHLAPPIIILYFFFPDSSLRFLSPSSLPSIVWRSLHEQFGALYDQLRGYRFSDT